MNRGWHCAGALFLSTVAAVGLARCGKAKCAAGSCPGDVCVPQSTRPCPCPGNSQGIERCAQDGLSYGECLLCPRVLFHDTFDTFPSANWQDVAGVSPDSTDGNPAPSVAVSPFGFAFSMPLFSYTRAVTFSCDLKIPPAGDMSVVGGEGGIAIFPASDAGADLVAQVQWGDAGTFPYPRDGGWHTVLVRSDSSGALTSFVDGQLVGTGPRRPSFDGGYGVGIVLGRGGSAPPSVLVRVDNVWLTEP